jgi:hypothetical protein
MADEKKDRTATQEKPHTELRRREGEDKPEGATADRTPRPRVPLDRVPDAGDDDDLFNDMPV